MTITIGTEYEKVEHEPGSVGVNASGIFSKLLVTSEKSMLPKYFWCSYCFLLLHILHIHIEKSYKPWFVLLHFSTEVCTQIQSDNPAIKVSSAISNHEFLHNYWHYCALQTGDYIWLISLIPFNVVQDKVNLIFLNIIIPCLKKIQGFF